MAAEAVTWKRSLGIPDGKRVVLFAGKFQSKKNPLHLLAAFLSVFPKDAVLLFVGAGPLMSSMRTAAAAKSGVFFAPFQNQSQMPRTYAACDVIVLPSIGEEETWGLCINEAMCLGLPAIVSTDVGCGPDLVEHGKTGWVFPAGHLGALTETLREALADPEELRRRGQAACERVKSYSFDAATAGLLTALASLQK